MNRAARSDVLKIFLYLGAVLLLAALISPWLYNFGKGLAEITQTKDTNRLIGWIADGARDAAFPAFFDRAMLLSALVLLFPLIQWLRIARPDVHPDESPWTLHIPRPSRAGAAGQPLRRDPRGPLNALTGFLLGASLLLLFGYGLTLAGLFGLREDVPWADVIRRIVPVALGIAILSELIFRGMVLGVFLRAMRPIPAILVISFLFAFVHFLQPPAGVEIPDPESRRAGFHLLGEILGRFMDPRPLLADFATLFAVSLVLGYARLRTASLWLPIGLHAGWVLGMLLFREMAVPAAAPGEAAQILAGASLLEGILPVTLILATGFLVHLLTLDHEASATENE